MAKGKLRLRKRNPKAPFKRGRWGCGSKQWQRTDGGCAVRKGGGFPCDDQWVNKAGTKEVTVRSTYTRHFDLPACASSIGAVTRLSGTSKHTKTLTASAYSRQVAKDERREEKRTAHTARMLAYYAKHKRPPKGMKTAVVGGYYRNPKTGRLARGRHRAFYDPKKWAVRTSGGEKRLVMRRAYADARRGRRRR